MARHDGRTWLGVPEWAYSWIVFWSEQWTLLKILDAAGKFVIVIALGQWFFEAGSRKKDQHYRAWQIINSARGGTGDGGRLDALQDLNKDGVSLASAPLSNAYLIRIDLQGAELKGAVLSGANLVEAELSQSNLFLADLTNATLAGANLESADLSSAKLINANLAGADLRGAKLVGADLTGAKLIGANLLNADLAQATREGSNFCGSLMPDGSVNRADCSNKPALEPQTPPQ
jgi:hypothetical protein